jgi:hypothetical protein
MCFNEQVKHVFHPAEPSDMCGPFACVPQKEVTQTGA